MGRPAIKWGQVVRYCNKYGYTIRDGKGGEKVIISPPNASAGPRSRQPVRIGHKCCNRDGDELYGCYVSKLRNVLNFDMDELMRM